MYFVARAARTKPRVQMNDEVESSGSEASPAYLAELRKRIWSIDDRLFMFLEVPRQTPLTLEVMFDRLEELAVGLDQFAYVVDLRGVKRPDASARDKLKERVLRINPRLAHAGLAIGSNAVIRAVAKLVSFAIGFRSFSFHDSIDEATEACRRALK
jgi:hypothetical protein